MPMTHHFHTSASDAKFIEEYIDRDHESALKHAESLLTRGAEGISVERCYREECFELGEAKR